MQKDLSICYFELLAIGVSSEFSVVKANIVSKAHSRAALIRRFKSRDSRLLFRAFTVFVRPLLEYCSPVWNPHYHCHIEKIESVQR